MCNASGDVSAESVLQIRKMKAIPKLSFMMRRMLVTTYMIQNGLTEKSTALGFRRQRLRV